MLNTHVILWHGSIRSAAFDIQANGIDLTRGRNNLDFGRGFYTTTNERQARNWAYVKFRNLPPVDQAADRPALVQFRIRLDILAPLNCLMFVRGDATHDAFWSFVHQCRLSPPAVPRTHLHPSRAAPDDWYDVVCGPLAATWPPHGRVALQDSDQFSFHTTAGIGILEDVINVGQPEFQIILL